MDTEGCGSLFSENLDFLQQLISAWLHILSLETEEAGSGKYYSNLKGMQEGKQVLFLPNGHGEQQSALEGLVCKGLYKQFWI